MHTVWSFWQLAYLQWLSFVMCDLHCDVVTELLLKKLCGGPRMETAVEPRPAFPPVPIYHAIQRSCVVYEGRITWPQHLPVTGLLKHLISVCWSLEGEFYHWWMANQKLCVYAWREISFFIGKRERTHTLTHVCS